MPYTKLQRALDELLAQFVKDYGETAILRLIESNQRTEQETRQVPIPVEKLEENHVD